MHPVHIQPELPHNVFAGDRTVFEKIVEFRTIRPLTLRGTKGLFIFFYRRLVSHASISNKVMYGSQRLIGGEFELDSGGLARKHDPKSSKISFGFPHQIWLDTGRSALNLALRVITSHHSPTRAWLPSYICQSVTDVFQARGYAISTYEVNEDLTIEPPKQIQARELFFYIHYFGARNTGAQKWLDSKKRDFWVIEDAVQAPWIGDAHPYSDFIFTSLRKAVAQPDGALLESREEIGEIELAPADETFVSSKVMGKKLRASGADASAYLPLFLAAEDKIDAEGRLATTLPREISAFSRALMETTDFTAAAEKRKNNFSALGLALRKWDKVSPVLHLSPGEVPLFFPVFVANGKRSALQSYLKERNVFCPVHWPGSAPGRKEMLSLPIDQRYGSADMETIAKIIGDFYER